MTVCNYFNIIGPRNNEESCQSECSLSQSLEVIIVAADNDARLLGHSGQFHGMLALAMVRFLSTAGCRRHLYAAVSRC